MIGAGDSGYLAAFLSGAAGLYSLFAGGDALKVMTSVAKFAIRLLRAADYLRLVGNALPQGLRIMLIVWLAAAVFAPPPPFDAGVTELIGAALGVILWLRYRPLLRVVWRAAAS